MGDVYVQGYQFMPAAGYQQTTQTPASTWQAAQAQGAMAQAGVPPPLPTEVPPPLPADAMQPAVMQQTNQLGMQAWGQGAVQQPQQGWDQQQVSFMAQQQWQPQQMQQWPVVQEQQQQQQQWQAQVSQQTWQGQEQWQVQQQPAQPQQQWQQPPPQPKASGKGDWRELWRQQLQQQQQQQQWGQGMGMQQWGQGMGNQQPYGGMYNQQQYNYGQQQPQQGMMHQEALFNQYGQQQQMQQQQPQQLPDMPPNPQQAWGGNMYQQQQGPMSQQGAYAAGPQHMQQQGPGAPSTQLLGTSAAVANSDYNMGGMGAPGLQQQSLPQPAAPARPPSPPKPLDLSQMLLPPGRDSRPKRLLLLLRGPPGCGKSHLARTIRQLEVSAGGQAPRLHSMDDYFMVDVEQDGDEVPGSKRRGSAAVTSQEYQYDAALEPSYWKSLLRAAGKTLSDRLHPLVLLDAPALRAEQVREVWKVVQGAGAELLVVNPLTTDPEVCFKQNVHKHSLEFITAQAKLFEAAPATFTCADAASLYQDKKAVRDSSPTQQGTVDAAAAAFASISEVDMAVDDDLGPAAAAAGIGTDAAEPDSTEPATSCGTPSSRPRGKSSRWEDDSDADDADRDPPAAATGTRVSPEGQHAAKLEGRGSDADGSSTAADRPKKKARLADGLVLDAFDAESLLAGVNQELELMDAAEGSTGKAAGTPGAAGRAGSGPLGVGGGNSSSSSGGGRLGGILKKHGTPNSRCKKVRVRWPDLSDQAAQQGFRIAAPVRPLAEVFWVEGLGPSKELWMAEADLAAGSAADVDGVDDAHHGPAAAGAAGTHVRNTFADQVRAEHRAEHDLFRAILLGQSNTPAGPPSAHKAEAAGSVPAPGGEPRLFMQRKS